MRPLAAALRWEGLVAVAVPSAGLWKTKSGLRSGKGDPDSPLSLARLGHIGAAQSPVKRRRPYPDASSFPKEKAREGWL